MDRMLRTSHHHPELSGEGPANGGGSGTLGTIVRAWDRFWFRPADPLPLGVIRIFTGIVILYLHLIYSFDLLALVGPDGWLNHDAVNYFRNDVPFTDVPRDWSLYSNEE